MKITKMHCRMFAWIESAEWFTNAQLSEQTKVSRATAARFTRFLDKMKAMERVELYPEPLFKLLPSPSSESGQIYINLLKDMSSTLKKVS